MTAARFIRTIDSIALLAFLTGLYPGLFFVSNNWFMIGTAQSFYLLLFLVSVTLLAISLLHLLLSRLLPGRAARAAVLIACVYILAGYFDFIIVDLQDKYDSVDFRSLILVAIAIPSSFLLIRLWKKQDVLDLVTPFNAGLLIMTSLALGNWAISVLVNYDKIFNELSTDRRAAEIYNQTQFKSKPNIYLIVPDSYPSNRLLNRFFHFENREFSEQLQSLGFRIYDDYFSSYPSSVESVHSMFSMNHNYFKKSIGNDAIALRAIIAGRDNDVISVLSNNGYESIFIHDTDYLFQEYCFIERCMPASPRWDRLRATLQNFYFFEWLPNSNQKYSAVIEMKKQISQTNEARRTFIYGHFMGAHSGVKNLDKRFEPRLPWFRKIYPDRLRNINRLMLEQVRQISSEDPSAIVIIVGDHGTWAGADRTDTGFSEDEILDKFNVFLAIKWGTDYNGQYDNEIKSGVNLFRYIFAYLSQNESILETRANDESYLLHNGVWKVVRDGRVLERPEHYGPRP